MNVERREPMYAAADLALATLSASETPPWLRQMALATYNSVCWDLSYNSYYSSTREDRSGLLLWDGAYEYQVTDLLAHLPDQIKAQCPADALLADLLAKGIDAYIHSVDMRLELLSSLRRTLNRLLHACADAGTESFDSVTDDNIVFLGHLARTDPFPNDDDDEIDYDTDTVERDYNHHGANN